MIIGSGLRVCAFEDDDLRALAAFHADPSSARMAFGVQPLPQSLEDVRSYVADIGGSDTDHLWAIRDDKDCPVGFFRLFGIDALNRTLFTASSIYKPSDRGRGLGTGARRLVLDYVFNELNFRRIYGRYLDNNEASRRSHAKVGAEVVGLRRRYWFVDGRYHDAVMYMVRQERFRELHPRPVESVTGSSA